MDRELHLYWEAFEELVSTQDILKTDFNPVFQFEDQLIDGAMVDLGCEQTSPLIKYAGITDRRLIGIDKETSQLLKLRSRMSEIAGAEDKAWELITGDLQRGALPGGPYAMVIMYNILHFFSLKECKALIAKLDKYLAKGTLISICVHSTKHPLNDAANPDIMAYFKHFFSQEDVDILFPSDRFDCLYRSDIERKYGKKDGEVTALWAEKVIKDFNITDSQEKANIRHGATSQQSTAELINVYRKR